MQQPKNTPNLEQETDAEPQVTPLFKKDFFAQSVIALILFVLVILSVTIFYEVPIAVAVISAIFSGMFGGVIFVNIVLYRLGVNPKEYRKFLGVPITRLSYYQQGGRPKGSIKTGQNLPPSVYSDETQAFIREARRIYQEEGFKEFKQFCDKHGYKESTVRGWIKRYGDIL